MARALKIGDICKITDAGSKKYLGCPVKLIADAHELGFDREWLVMPVGGWHFPNKSNACIDETGLEILP